MAAGYDIAYDHLSFSHISPWQIMRIQNLRLYSLDAGNYKEWQCDEFSVSSNFFPAIKSVFISAADKLCSLENILGKWMLRKFPQR